MTKEQKLALADRLMNIEFKYSPVTGSPGALRNGLASKRGLPKKNRKFTPKEIEAIRAFYVTGSSVKLAKPKF